MRKPARGDDNDARITVHRSVLPIPHQRQDGDERKMSRPFGVALLLAGYDDKGPQLFFSDPSGTFTRFKAKAIGACVLAAHDWRLKWNGGVGALGSV